MKALQAQIDTIEQKLREQIESIRKGLVSQLAIAQSSLQQLEQNLNTSQTDQQQKKTASAKYLDAKYRYLQERQLLEAAKTKLNTETMERTMPQKPASIRDAAEPALFPSKPKVFLNMFLGCLAGLALGLGTAFFLEYLDTSVKTMEQVEALLSLPVLAIIPRKVSNLATIGPDSPDGEAYRILKTNADFTRKKVVASVFSITSGGPSEGKSTTVCNLATSYAQSGQQTLIIDADLRRPSQHELLSLPNGAGLSDYLHDTSKLEDVIQVTTVQNLFTITSGSRPIESVSLLNSDRFKQLLATAKEWFDVVLVDCPPLLGLSDATIVCSLTEATIIVAQHRRFPRSMLVRVKGLLTGIEAHILGVVLNNVDVRQDPAYQYYTSYSKYYTGTKKKRSSPTTPVATGRSYQPPSTNGSKSGSTTTISRISTKRPSFSGPEPEGKKETETDQEDVY
ncbi:MAG: polysaccharide biosynthesis tyrosine autokinase [Verrucomicrobia bacterium]|nr:polysaccharide biosynthesis tyrosine autokinase [Verrucomicrobiota bacterium]